MSKIGLYKELRKALSSIASDQLRVDIISGGGGGGDASAANQLIEITALQLIDDLRNALGSVNTDDLQVDVKTSALPSGAATEAKQDTQETSLDAIQVAAENLTARTTITPVNAQVFNAVQTSYTSAATDVSDYRKLLLYIDLDVTNTPTDIQIIIQFSDDNVTFYNFMDGPFGSLMYEDSAGDKLECISGECLGTYLRVYVVATGTTAANTFELTVKLDLVR